MKAPTIITTTNDHGKCVCEAIGLMLERPGLYVLEESKTDRMRVLYSQGGKISEAIFEEEVDLTEFNVFGTLSGPLPENNFPEARKASTVVYCLEGDPEKGGMAPGWYFYDAANMTRGPFKTHDELCGAMADYIRNLYSGGTG